MGGAKREWRGKGLGALGRWKEGGGWKGGALEAGGGRREMVGRKSLAEAMLGTLVGEWSLLVYHSQLRLATE